MNRRLCVWVGSILGTLSVTALAIGQVPALPPGNAAAGGGGGIPLQAQTAADETPYLSSINKFVTDQVALLAGTDYAAQTAARQKVVSALVRGSTPAYYSAFAKSWSTACAAVIAKNPPLGVRLNIAIATATLTDNGQPPEAEPLVVQLLNDREPCVVLWAIRAAKPLILVLVQNPPALAASPLTAAIVSAVKKCGKSDVSGIITSDAYSALAFTTIPGKTPQQVAPLLPPLVKPVLDILDFRTTQHAAGLVQLPGAERVISTWLSGNYPSVSAAEQQRMVQLMVRLETYVGQRSDLYQYDKKQMTQIRDMLKYVASALKVIGGNGAAVCEWIERDHADVPGGSPGGYLQQHKKGVPDDATGFPDPDCSTTNPGDCSTTTTGGETDNTRAGSARRAGDMISSGILVIAQDGRKLRTESPLWSRWGWLKLAWRFRGPRLAEVRENASDCDSRSVSLAEIHALRASSSFGLGY